MAEPPNPSYLTNYALALIDAGETDTAAACLVRAIGLDPSLANAHLALGELLLARGEMAPGWLEYEWRNRLEAARGTMPPVTSAAWNGMRLPRGRLLLVGDQGYGDTIQFARYIPLAAERCAEVVLACSPALAPLLAALPGVGQCHTRWDTIPGHAAHARLSSLPGLFGTELATIPAPIPYLLADPARVERWRDRVRASSGLRIGIAWRGRPTHPNDHRRSMPLAAFATLAAIPGVELVSLQPELAEVDRPAADRIGLLQPEGLADFGDTAALIGLCDLIVTADTAVAHLAGALGAPVWVLLPMPADWRWLVGRDDSPWYPGARLFRQGRAGEWDEVIAAVAVAVHHQQRLAS
jgi:hypothetical protein